MISWLAGLIFRSWGWSIEGTVPKHIPKKLYVVIPHTSNWDFPVGLLLKFYQGLDVGYIAKSSLFKWPYGWFFRMTGGVPVDRSKSTNFIDTMVNVFQNRDRFSTAIAPEGTRKKVDRLKSGFYYIAKQANVPMIYTKFDWKNKIVHFSDPLMAEDTYEQELERIHQHFAGVQGYIPEFGYRYSKS